QPRAREALGLYGLDRDDEPAHGRAHVSPDAGWARPRHARAHALASEKKNTAAGEDGEHQEAADGKLRRGLSRQGRGDNRHFIGSRLRQARGGLDHHPAAARAHLDLPRRFAGQILVIEHRLQAGSRALAETHFKNTGHVIARDHAGSRSASHGRGESASPLASRNLKLMPPSTWLRFSPSSESGKRIDRPSASRPRRRNSPPRLTGARRATVSGSPRSNSWRRHPSGQSITRRPRASDQPSGLRR